MKEEVRITRFGGMVGIVDERDAQDGMAVYAKNIDVYSQMGALVPLPLDTETAEVVTSDVTTIQNGAAVTGIFVDQSGATRPVKQLDGLGGTPAIGITLETLTTTTAPGPFCGVSDGESSHLGVGNTEDAKPRWAGQVYHNQFGADPDSALTKLTAHDAQLRSDFVGANVSLTSNNKAVHLPENINLAADASSHQSPQFAASDEIFPIGTKWHYYASAVFDSYQESSLTKVLSVMVGEGTSGIVYETPDGYTSTPDTLYDIPNAISGGTTNKAWGSGGSTDWVKFTRDTEAELVAAENLRLADGLSKIRFRLIIRTGRTSGSDPILNRRVTSVKIYRARGDRTNALGEQIPESPYLVKEIGINDASWSAEYTGAATSDDFAGTANLYRDLWFTDENIPSIILYEEEADITPSLPNMQLHYGLSCVANSYHIVGQCWNPTLKQIDGWLFRSKPFRYDTFDWVRDYMVLPEKPVAIKSFLGKIYAFSTGNTYVINPGTFDIEDTWQGIGTYSKDSVVVSDRGMFFVDEHNIYQHNGTSLNVIGAAVLENQFNSVAGWRNHDTGYNPLCVYLSKYDSLLVIYNADPTGDYGVYGLMYHILAEKWTFITFPYGASSKKVLGTVVYEPDGEVLVGISNTALKFYRLFAAGTNRPWQFVSQNLAKLGMKTVFYKLRLGHRGTAPSTVEVYDNDPDYSASPLAVSMSAAEDGIEEGTINRRAAATGWDYVRNFVLSITGTGTQTCTELSIIKREITPR